MSTHTQVELGSDFVGYRIEALIGRGGMGVVYRATDLRLKRAVALKLVAPELALDERFQARFARESEVAMSLEHPNVVPIYDAGDVDGRLYLAMRYVEGTDLRALLRREGALEPARALAITRQVGAALDAAHARGLVHRDVKPSNVLLDKEEHVYLGDLGLTRRLDEEATRAEEDRSLGTPAYLAPEQIEGKPVDARADIYSLGCLLYECLTGQPPFAADSRLAVAWAHLEEKPPIASMANVDLPEAIDPVLYKAMAKEPGERYATCAALISDAESALGLRPLKVARRRRRVVLLAVAVLALVVAAAVAAALVARGTREAKVALPAIGANALVRIDPVRNVVADVIPAGWQPKATAVGETSVWVYHFDGIVTEIDAGNGAELQRVQLSATPLDTRLVSGPFLVADQSGAWIIGTDNNGNGLLTELTPGGGGKQEFPLDVQPKAVGLGEGAVWILGRGSRGDEVLRIDPTTGEVGRRTRFPASVYVDSLAVGLGSVWTVASSTSTLYRIDPRSSVVKQKGEYDGKRAGRPLVRSGFIWLEEYGRDTLIIDPRTLAAVNRVCCSGAGPSTAAFGSAWLADLKSGEVARFDAASKQLTTSIPIVGGPRSWGGLCISSIAAGAGSIWVTVAHC